MDRDKRVEIFFTEYEKRFADALAGKDPDVKGTSDAFAGCFVEASPVGITCSENDEKFMAAVPKGYEFFKSIGTESMKIGSKKIKWIDDLHAMVKIHWLSIYRKGDKKVQIDFDVHYFIQQQAQSVKIFAYITGDEQKVLKENGLL